jgi:uncharacterized protein (DUF3084 family)
MTFWAILILMVLVAGLVAYVGDLVAKRVGKRHWRLLGLRPRASATLVAVGTGVLIALGAFGAFFLVVRDARETILQAEAIRQERDRLRTEVERLEWRAGAMFSQNEQLRTERDEFERNNNLLARQLTQNLELQQQTRQELEGVLVEREILRQEVGKLQAAGAEQRRSLEELKQIRQNLQQEKDRLEASRAELLAQSRRVEQRLRQLETASTEAQARLVSLQARTRELERQLRQLEAEKRSLEGDVAVLGTGGQAQDSSENTSRMLEAAQRENQALRTRLLETQQEVQQLRERNRLIAASLDQSLRMSLLAEQQVVPGNEQAALGEVTRRADNRLRLIGLRGMEVVDQPSLNNLKPGLLLARIQNISSEGRVRVVIEYRAREQAFAEGEVLAYTTLLLPASMGEMRRKFNALGQMAEDRLSALGWVPEKLAQGGIALEEFVSLASQLTGRRGGTRVAVVALANLYPTEPPRLGLRVLP